FSFVAPSSGSVKITTDIALTGSGKLDDTQIALYSTTNVNDYSLFRHLVSNEDGSTNNSGISTQVFYSGLTPGVTYYIQVDGWNTGTGAFCITVSETIDIATPTTSCQSYTATVNGSATGYSTLWFNVYSKPGTYDIGKPVAAIKTSQNLGTVTVQETRNASVQTHPNGVKYMQRYFNVNSSQNTTGSKSVRLFHTDTELSAFKTATGMGSATAEDLNISHYDGTTENCTPNDNTSGTVTLINGGNVTATSIGSSGIFFLEFLSPGFSEMGSHFGLTPLPVEMLYFHGKAGRHTNVLEWATETENNLQSFTLERSADGVSQWIALADIAPNAGKRYVFEDNTNLKKSYYRLKINDLDETSSLSSIVAIERSDRGAVAAVYPNPVSGLLYIQIEADEESDASIRVHSLDGRLMLEAAHSLFKGSNQIPLDMSAMPAGAYILNVTDGVSSNAPMRIIKE
ncbi:MAG: T9SS type A sorting domain-containing protein, partial [Saprospiraceae bacterium]|nr:T9SS type A sorting domain-containing protein [Saprospiraceae bacterium]